jgi:hypothetical protein
MRGALTHGWALQSAVVFWAGLGVSAHPQATSGASAPALDEALQQVDPYSSHLTYDLTTPPRPQRT